MREQLLLLRAQNNIVSGRLIKLEKVAQLVADQIHKLKSGLLALPQACAAAMATGRAAEIEAAFTQRIEELLREFEQTPAKVEEIENDLPVAIRIVQPGHRRGQGRATVGARAKVPPRPAKVAGRLRAKGRRR
jgi:microcystin degradation protein MlrC